MSASMDELSPDYLGEDRISVTLQPNSSTAAFHPMYFLVDYTQCAPEDVVLPLEMIVRGPSKNSYKRKIYSIRAPSVLHYKPTEGGIHLIMLREVAHNRWWGRINVNVTGPSLSRPRFG